MKYKYLPVKLLNIIVIIGLIVAYQKIALERADNEVKALELAQKAAAEERKEQGAESIYKDGEFTGSAEGYGGQIEMKVTIKDGNIDAIDKVSAPGEDAAYWDMSEDMISQILAMQDPNVDTVSGATMTSIGIKNAVVIALQKAVNQ